MHPGKRQQAHFILLWWRLFLESVQENVVVQNECYDDHFRTDGVLVSRHNVIRMHSGKRQQGH